MSSLRRCWYQKLVMRLCLASCVACSSEVIAVPPGAIINVWTERPPYSEKILPGLDEVALFERVADQLQARFVLPHDLFVSHLSCGSVNAFYDPMEARIRMCDELLARVVAIVRSGAAESDEEVLAQVSSTWVWMFLHELGHAFIDMFELPVLGNEEHAVENFAALLLVEAGEASMAQRAVGYWAALAMRNEMDFSDEHGLDLERYYDGLCLVYGSDPAAHADIVEQGLLPLERSRRCPAEYQELLGTWKSLLGDRLKDAP